MINENLKLWISENYPLMNNDVADLGELDFTDMDKFADWLEKKYKSDSILMEAESITNGERGVDYGDPVESFSKIAQMASIMSRKYISPIDCCNIQIALKLVRESVTPKRDNLVDAVGYIKLLNVVKTKLEKLEMLK